MSRHPGLHNGDQPWALFPMAPPKPTKLSSFLTERVSLLAENRSFSNILRRSYFSTGHLRQYMSADLPASFSLSKYKPAKRKKKEKQLTLEIPVWPQIKYCLVQKTPLFPPKVKEGVPVAQQWRIRLPVLETQLQSLDWEDPLEKEMATHSSILAWEIPRTEEPGRLQPMELQKNQMRLGD